MSPTAQPVQESTTMVLVLAKTVWVRVAIVVSGGLDTRFKKPVITNSLFPVKDGSMT